MASVSFCIVLPFSFALLFAALLPDDDTVRAGLIGQQPCHDAPQCLYARPAASRFGGRLTLALRPL